MTREPPGIGAPFIQLVPAVDADGNDRAGIRMPELAVPLATHTGWNYRHASIGAPDRLSGEIGSYFAFPRTRAEGEESGDPRRSIEERYRDRNDYLGRVTQAALKLVSRGYLLTADLPNILIRASRHYDWAVSEPERSGDRR